VTRKQKQLRKLKDTLGKLAMVSTHAPIVLEIAKTIEETIAYVNDTIPKPVCSIAPCGETNDKEAPYRPYVVVINGKNVDWDTNHFRANTRRQIIEDAILGK